MDGVLVTLIGAASGSLDRRELSSIHGNQHSHETSTRRHGKLLRPNAEMFIVVTCYCVAGQESRSGSASRGFYDVYRSYGSSPSTREELPSMQMLQYGYKVVTLKGIWL
ncbi:hypothetical protein Mp_4g22910 [Marchantia polymorpha subsp. ruderalis]|uniref:Uncharacterized protein n=2 Tax=Marchantia polymorpha TaxID=3197 RepID=A0AAF6BCS6_MARPO|nr:hypothetical protein MARPO_0020s0053 [Marchantia polymorpha]BBN09810.1 hypothetical protein Mp_4g22910 [Marchantia polymorpha subsp. ruderalis]|eukprot:PTQ44385.1 hypothetical protein MARPO_0020s0053 [Marchantia polymorpha]